MTDNDADDGYGAKRDKTSVNYREADSAKRQCKNCRYSYGPSGNRRCMKVKGQIKPHDVCDLWRGM